MKKPKSVLLVTDFSKPWSSGWYYKTGFEKNGYKVLLFDPAAVHEAETAALDLLRHTRADFILHTKDELPATAFQAMRTLAPVVQWYPDPVIPEWLPPYVRSADIFLTMSEGLLDAFRKLNQNSFWLSQGFEPSFFALSGVTEEDRRAFSADVAFVGNLGSKPQYLARRDALARVIDTGCMLKWWGPEIPWKISNIPLIYGRIGKAYGGRFIWGEAYAKVAKLSKIFLAFDSRPDIRKSMSARMYTAVGCGAFYLCKHVDGIEEVLVPDKEIVTFHTEDEMIDKIRRYLRDDEAREKISVAGQARVLRDHVYEVRIRQMCDMIEKSVIFPS